MAAAVGGWKQRGSTKLTAARTRDLVAPLQGKYPKDEYPGMFPGFLHMIRNPEKVFPP